MTSSGRVPRAAGCTCRVGDNHSCTWRAPRRTGTWFSSGFGHLWKCPAATKGSPRARGVYSIVLPPRIAPLWLFFFFSGDKCHEVLLSQMASRVSQHGSDLPHFPFSSVKFRANGGWVGGPLSGKKEAGPRRALQTEGSRRERGSHIHMPRGSRALALE